MSRGARGAAPTVVHLDRREANAVEVGEELFMFLDDEDAGLVPARCPHRGGPLHVATVEEGGKGAALVCPWHESRIPLRALQARAVATVQSGSAVRAVIDAPAGARINVRHLPVRIAASPSCADRCARSKENTR